MEKTNLEKLKENYKKLQEKYQLPGFEELSAEFWIEKAAETETDFLIREIGKLMADKFSNYLRFVEAVLNPVNAPMFVFSIIKSITDAEKKKLSEIYKKLAKIEIRLVELDVGFSEEKEANFIKESYEIWKEIKKDFIDIVEKVKSNWDNKFENNAKGYFG